MVQEYRKTLKTSTWAAFLFKAIRWIFFETSFISRLLCKAYTGLSRSFLQAREEGLFFLKVKLTGIVFEIYGIPTLVFGKVKIFLIIAPLKSRQEGKAV